MPSISDHLTLNADVGSWVLYHTRATDKKFDAFKKRVFQRDRHTCVYCGFQSQHDMCVVNFDGQYKNNTIDNLVTACPFCMQVNFLPFVGKDGASGGTLIHLPDMRQADLNGLCHVLFCAIENQTDYAERAQKIYNSLRLCADPIEQQWGKGLSQPNMMGQMLIDTPLEDQAHWKQTVLKDLRLLPSQSAFKEQIERWSSMALEEGLTEPDGWS